MTEDTGIFEALEERREREQGIYEGRTPDPPADPMEGIALESEKLTRNAASIKKLAAQTKQSMDALAASLATAELKEPKAQTKASAKYQAKAGYSTKSYKLNAEQSATADAFKAACEKTGTPQASMLAALMRQYLGDKPEAATPEAVTVEVVREVEKRVEMEKLVEVRVEVPVVQPCQCWWCRMKRKLGRA